MKTGIPYLLILCLASAALGQTSLEPQTLGSQSARAKPDRHGPFRNDPAQGIPKHAYSPFDDVGKPPPYTPGPGRDYQEGRLVIRVAPGVKVHARPNVQLQGAGPNRVVALTDNAPLNRALAAHGITRLDPVCPNAKPPVQPQSAQGAPIPDLTRWYRTRGTAVVKQAVETLAKEPSIDVVEPDYLRHTLPREEHPANPNSDLRSPISHLPSPRRASLHSLPGPTTDPLFDQQWHLPACHIPEAWAYLENPPPPLAPMPPGGNPDIVIAVIDTGVDYNHPDLATRMWRNPGETGVDAQGRDKTTNGVDDDNDGFVDDVFGVAVVSDNRSHSGNPMDDHGHGTHVAGIIAAQAGNGQGGVGVAYNLKIMAIKAAQYSGVLSASDIAEAIHYAVAQGVDVINMSFGGYAKSQVEEDALAVAFGQAVLVAAAGNDSKVNLPCPFGADMYPAAYNWVLGVMASTAGGARASFSNYDCVPHDKHEYEVMAPGVDVWSTLPNNQYAAWDGTSMATPIVSGIAALVRTRFADKDVYSSRFVMGQIAANASPVVNALNALTKAPKPELSYLEHWIFDTTNQAAGNDNDGRVDAGETIDLAIVIRNHWGKADPVMVTLDAWAQGAVAADPYVTWKTNQVDYGAVGSFNWDDNGLIYDAQGVITGVRHPFTFSVSPDCPNDHVIPFRLTMACRNGLDPADSNDYTFESRFNLVVQRGRELPRIISTNMTLTKDDYWIVPDQTLVQAGATLTVTEGTQIQFFTSAPNNPYAQNGRPNIQVEGNLDIRGTRYEPVEVFCDSAFQGYPIFVLQSVSGNTVISYSRIRNPVFGYANNDYNGQGPYVPLTAIDHCHFSQDLLGIAAFNTYYQDWVSARQAPVIVAKKISNSLFQEVGHYDFGMGLAVNRTVVGSCYDSCILTLSASSADGNVFLENKRGAGNELGRSKAAGAGTVFDSANELLLVSPMGPSTGGSSYVIVSGSSYSSSFDTAEGFAKSVGGHLAAISDIAENDYVQYYAYSQVRGLALSAADWNAHYPDLAARREHFINSPMLGLTDRETAGVFTWTSGEAVQLTMWGSGHPHINNNPLQNHVVLDSSGGRWYSAALGDTPKVLEIPGQWTREQLIAARQDFVARGGYSQFKNNAILNVWWDANVDHWMRFTAQTGRDVYRCIVSNYWGTTSRTLIDAAIFDFNDDFNLNRYVYEPILTVPPESTYPFVADVSLTAGAAQTPTNGSVLELSGGEYVHIPTTPLLQDVNDITIEGWIKCADPNRGQFIYNQHRIYYQYVELTVRSDAGIGFIVFGKKFGSAAGLISANQWVHVAAVYHGASGTANLYVNGLPVATSVEQLYGVSIRNEDVAIGAYPNGSNPETMFRGQISEVRRWNVARTSDQIQANYKTSVDPGSEPGLIAYWTFNGNAQDSTSHGHHGSLVGEPAFVSPMRNPAPTYSTSLDTVGAEEVTFTVTYNRDMDTTVQPQVTFGPDTPVTDYTVHPVNGGWADARTWLGTFNITPITGDGYQLMRIAGGRAADDPWLVCGEDSGRFRFEIITSGTEAMNLQATGGEGRVDLGWTQDDFTLLQGYNLYRSTSQGGSYSRLNGTIIPSQQKSYADGNVQPGQPYYYKFTVMTDRGESDFSNIATATPKDTIPPVIAHSPATSAEPGQQLTLWADVTDNVGVQAVTLYFRAIGAEPWVSRPMTRPTGSGNRYYGTVEGSRLVSPGIEYYIEATDGVTPVRTASAGFPHRVTVVDRPVVTAVSPNRGSASGGAAVVIAGSNFKSGATVTFGGGAAGGVVVASPTQIECLTPAHFPETVDVVVRNPDGQSGTLLRGYTFESDVVSVSLPNTGGAQHDTVQVPVNAVNVRGLVAASLTVTFDSAVLRGLNVRAGTLTSGWTLVPNTATAGQILVSMASNGGGVSGSGSLAWLEFEVLGAPGSTSALHFTRATFNGGAIPRETTDGSFAVALAYQVAGRTTFWKDGSAVSGVTLTLTGNRVFTGQSGANGAYTVTGAPPGAYTLVPSKSDQTGTLIISGYDASLVLQHDVGLITLTGPAATAGDVNKSGTIDSMDAYYILQKSVELITLPFTGAGVVWDFVPTSRSYANLSSDQSGQDFTAILLGDVSGNWTVAGAGGQSALGRRKVNLKGPGTESQPVVRAAPAAGKPVVLALKTVGAAGSGNRRLWVVAKADQTPIYSLDLTVDLAAKGTPAKAVKPGPLAQTMVLAINTKQAGLVRLSLAGALPVKGTGALAVVELPDVPESQPQIESAVINEGAVAVEVDPTGATFEQDTDGDGQSDWTEIRAGTDPADRQSVFALKDAKPQPDGNVLVRWSSIAGQEYQLQAKWDLAEPNWENVGQAIKAQDTTCSQTDTAAKGKGQRVYRVLLVE